MYFEHQEPYYHFYSTDMLGALLFSNLISMSKGDIKCEKPKYNIPKMKSKEALKEFCNTNWGNPSLFSLFSAYTNLRRSQWIDIIHSWQPGTDMCLEEYLEKNPDEDVSSDEVKQQRVKENHGDCVYAYVNYMKIKEVFLNGFEVH